MLNRSLKTLNICLFTLILAGCNVSGPNFPADADETLDWGILYARFGDEWWSIKNGKKWNKVRMTSYPNGIPIITKKGKSVEIDDFGDYANLVHEVYNQEFINWQNEPQTERGVVFKYGQSLSTVISALDEAWGTKKYKEIQLRCFFGCDIAI